MANGNDRFFTTFTGFCFFGIPAIVGSILMAPVLALAAIGTVVARVLKHPTMV